MVSERTRNLAVGLTMIVALIMLMYGILLIGKGPGWGGLRPYVITLESPNANGITPSAKVDLNGVVVGQVTSVILARKSDGTLGTRVGLSIDGSVDIPTDSTVSFGKGYVGSSTYCSISATQAKGPNLPHDGSAILQAAPADGGLIPQEVFTDIHVLKGDLSDLSQQLTGVAKDMHALLSYSPPAPSTAPIQKTLNAPAKMSAPSSSASMTPCEISTASSAIPRSSDNSARSSRTWPPLPLNSKPPSSMSTPP